MSFSCTRANILTLSYQINKDQMAPPNCSEWGGLWFKVNIMKLEANFF